MMAKGYSFVWCNEAPVYETYLAERFKRIFFIRRALLRGSISVVHQSYSMKLILKSMIAFVIYTLALPTLFFLGPGLFMKYLVKDFDHIGKLSAGLGLNMRKYIKHL